MVYICGYDLDSTSEPDGLRRRDDLHRIAPLPASFSPTSNDAPQSGQFHGMTDEE